MSKIEDLMKMLLEIIETSKTVKEKEAKVVKPPPREANPDVGDRTLIISDEVVRSLLTAAYLVGDIELNGLGLVSENDGEILWEKAWVLSDIDGLKDNGERRPSGSSVAVKMDPEQMAVKIAEVVEMGRSPRDLRLYWHTHGIWSSFFSSTDLKAIQGEVEFAGGNEIINVVFVPGSFDARIDSGLGDDKSAETIGTIKMEGENEKYRVVGNVQSSKLHLSTIQTAGSQYDWGRAPGKHDSLWSQSDWRRGQDNTGGEFAGCLLEELDELCPDCGGFIEEVDIGEWGKICCDCGRIMGGELDGIKLF